VWVSFMRRFMPERASQERRGDLAARVCPEGCSYPGRSVRPYRSGARRTSTPCQGLSATSLLSLRIWGPQIRHFSIIDQSRVAFRSIQRSSSLKNQPWFVGAPAWKVGLRPLKAVKGPCSKPLSLQSAGHAIASCSDLLGWAEHCAPDNKVSRATLSSPPSHWVLI